MAVIDRLILRLAIYELLTEPETPAKVIINEALELARTFSGEEPVPFVNGVLDAVRKTLIERVNEPTANHEGHEGHEGHEEKTAECLSL